MKLKQCVVFLVCCMFSGIAVAAPPDAGGEAGKGAKPAMSKAMQEMVGKDCPQYSGARGDDGRELECAKGKWRAVEQDGSTTAKMRAECKFTCRKSHGIEICKGNGPQCNGKTPPGW